MDATLHGLARRVAQNRLTRRDVLWLFGAAAMSGCAASPIDGSSILVGMSEEQERKTDREVAPHQFSQDMGAVQDGELNRYVSEVGGSMQTQTHRPRMPYSYRVLNANYINAYTFPAGAIGVTRGIMTELNDEAELAALLGHEMGHVNARHAAQRAGQGLLAEVAVAGLSLATSDSEWGLLSAVAGQVGASALLASYSRDNEREADALGQEYMVRSGYPASGMTDLQSLLVRQSKERPSLIETMFASHPMSSERMATARQQAETKYAASLKADPQRERYMDNTAKLRQLKPAIDACKQGETALAKKKFDVAEKDFATALQLAPNDYAANLLMARCLLAEGKPGEAGRYAETARTLYPQEAQAHKLAGTLRLKQRDPAGAYQAFDQFDRLLPGDPGIVFLKGVSLEASGNRKGAAEQYARFLQASAEGKPANYARKRLKAWGYVN